MSALDTVTYYETPEGIILRLKIAGPVSRACAWLIDALIKIGIGFALLMILSILKEAGIGIYLVCMFLIEWFYPVVFEVTSGATPGKKAMDLLVINDNGTPVSFTSSALRNLLRAADFLPFGYGFGLISMLINKDFKRLGDLAAGTLVVHDEKNGKIKNIQDAKPIQPPADLRVNEQRTLLDFSERSLTLSRERSIELANILHELTGKKGQEALDELNAYANWIFKGK